MQTYLRDVASRLFSSIATLRKEDTDPQLIFRREIKRGHMQANASSMPRRIKADYGEMIWDLPEDIVLPGFERYATVRIWYNVPDGKQGNDQPNPGRVYRGVQWFAYYPCISHWRTTLRMYMLAFEQGLTFRVKEKPQKEADQIMFNLLHWKDCKAPFPFNIGEIDKELSHMYIFDN